MRSQVWKRDQGVCALCGLDTKTLTKAWRARGCWEADHIVPVSEGGGLCGLDGYRTLCKGRGTNNCHGKVTGELRRRLNAAKRPLPLLEGA
jgi:5-methylcytosine-specific restriction endonuclease McrA